jgi:moderate conductance mechanosensitive channel
VKSLNLSKDWARAVVDILVPASADLNQVSEVLRGVRSRPWTTTSYPICCSMSLH